jgi:hypothetical protein
MIDKSIWLFAQEINFIKKLLKKQCETKGKLIRIFMALSCPQKTPESFVKKYSKDNETHQKFEDELKAQDFCQRLEKLLPSQVILLPGHVELWGTTCFNGVFGLNESLFMGNSLVDLAKLIICLLHELMHSANMHFKGKGNFFYSTPPMVGDLNTNKESGYFFETLIFSNIIDLEYITLQDAITILDIKAWENERLLRQIGLAIMDRKAKKKSCNSKERTSIERCGARWVKEQFQPDF